MEKDNNVLKKVGQAIIGLGITTVIDNVAKANLPGTAGRVTKMLCTIGSFGLGIIVTGALEEPLNKQIDELADAFKPEEIKEVEETLE